MVLLLKRQLARHLSVRAGSCLPPASPTVGGAGPDLGSRLCLPCCVTFVSFPLRLPSAHEVGDRLRVAGVLTRRKAAFLVTGCRRHLALATHSLGSARSFEK